MRALRSRRKVLWECITGYVSLGSPGSKCQDRIKSGKKFIRRNVNGGKKRKQEWGPLQPVIQGDIFIRRVKKGRLVRKTARPLSSSEKASASWMGSPREKIIFWRNLLSVRNRQPWFPHCTQSLLWSNPGRPWPVLMLRWAVKVWQLGDSARCPLPCVEGKFPWRKVVQSSPLAARQGGWI